MANKKLKIKWVASDSKSVLIGYKSNTLLESGYMYAPYIPLHTTSLPTASIVAIVEETNRDGVKWIWTTDVMDPREESIYFCVSIGSMAWMFNESRIFSIKQPWVNQCPGWKEINESPVINDGLIEDICWAMPQITDKDTIVKIRQFLSSRKSE
jgi:hypothetical protein